jgi:hypothetical protein
MRFIRELLKDGGATAHPLLRSRAFPAALQRSPPDVTIVAFSSTRRIGIEAADAILARWLGPDT